MFPQKSQKELLKYLDKTRTITEMVNKTEREPFAIYDAVKRLGRFLEQSKEDRIITKKMKVFKLNEEGRKFVENNFKL